MQSLLRVISLRTATEFITLTLLINKVTGFYGILALFTGYALNPLQLSHYIYSLVILGLAAYLAPAVRQPSEPLKILALAWLYVLDTVINAAYTVLFGMGWFVLLAQHLEGQPGEGQLPGQEMMDDTAGFTNPEVNATAVEVAVKPAPGLLSGQEAVVVSTHSAGGAGGVLESDMMTSIGLLALFSLVRVYFCLVVMSYARGMLRGYIANSSASTTGYETGASADPSMAANPFQTTEGWRGALGRTMLRFPSKRYWLGREEIVSGGESGMLSEWERATSGRFTQGGRKVLRVKVPDSQGVGERERRARSGTGPPPMSASSAKSDKKGMLE